MVNNILDLPKVGDIIISNENPTMEVEKLQCIRILVDDVDSSIKYAVFKSEYPEDDNLMLEDGTRFHCIQGYMPIGEDE